MPSGVLRPAGIGQPGQKEHGNAAAGDQPPERMRRMGEAVMHMPSQDGAGKRDAERGAGLPAGGGDRCSETGLRLGHAGHGRVGNGRIHHAEPDPEKRIRQQ